MLSNCEVCQKFTVNDALCHACHARVERGEIVRDQDQGWRLDAAALDSALSEAREEVYRLRNRVEWLVSEREQAKAAADLAATQGRLGKALGRGGRRRRSRTDGIREVVDYLACDLVAMHDGGATGIWAEVEEKYDAELIVAIINECSRHIRRNAARIIRNARESVA